MSYTLNKDTVNPT